MDDFGDNMLRDSFGAWNEQTMDPDPDPFQAHVEPFRDDMMLDFPTTPLHDDIVPVSPKIDVSALSSAPFIPQCHRRAPSQPAHNPFSFFQQMPSRNPANARRPQRTFEPSHDRQYSLPLPGTALPEDDSGNAEFEAVCNDPAIVFNPHTLGFIPSTFWPDKEFTFGELVRYFFQRKNNANSRFFHKLFNALKISEADPFYAVYLGVEWVNERVLKVDKKVFARLLSIKTIDGSLFHQQGNFPSHGFVEISPNDVDRAMVSSQDLDGVDYDKVRLLYHQPGIFMKGCGEEVLGKCRWTSVKKR